MNTTQCRQLYSEIGRRIKVRRHEVGMTQEQLSEQADLTRVSITNMEGGNQRLTIHALYDIAKGLQVHPLSLLPPPGS